jgi:DNA-binding transcriptional MerR regulator
MSNQRFLSTVGEIARQNSVPIHRVEYVVRSRRIVPAAKAGNARVFDDAQVARIAAELRRIARDREGAQ